MRRLLTLALCLVVAAPVLLTGCGRPLHGEAAWGLMRRVGEARRSLIVHGQLTTTVGVGDQTLQAEAEVAQGPEVTEMKYLSGKFQGWKVVEQDGLVWRVDPQGQPRAGQGGLGGGLGMRGAGQGQGLTIQRQWPCRVAGRWAWRYTVRPSGLSKAKVVLKLDMQNSFPLASTRYNTQGKVTSSTVYRTITFGGAPPARVAIPPVAQGQGLAGKYLHTRPSTEQKLAQTLGGELLKPRRLPEGFSPVGTFLSTTPRGDLAELRYSDGMRMLILLQMKRKPGQPAPSRGPAGVRRERLPRNREALRQWLQERKLPGQRPLWGQGRQPNAGHPGAEGRGRAGGIRQVLRSRLRGHVVHEMRGDRLVVVAGDLAIEDLQGVMDSIPQPRNGAAGPSTHF